MERGVEQPRTGTLTVEEWFGLPEDISGELVDGRLVEEEVPDAKHELVITWLTALLRAWMRGRGGFVLGSGAKLQLGRDRGRMPDASAYLPGGRRPQAAGPIVTPPDIAIEVVSPSRDDIRRDRIQKMTEYAAFGIRYYWLVDPSARVFEIYELESGGLYRRALGAADGTVEAVPGCTGLSLNLDELWSEIALLENDS
jgi:Uma2 family endonuclease